MEGVDQSEKRYSDEICQCSYSVKQWSWAAAA